MSLGLRRLLAVLTLGLGIGQAFDSGIRLAPPEVIAVVATAVALPVIAFLTSSRIGLILGAGVCAGLLTVVARMMSPVPLPTLSLIAFFPVAAVILTAAARRGAVTTR